MGVRSPAGLKWGGPMTASQPGASDVSGTRQGSVPGQLSAAEQRENWLIALEPIPSFIRWYKDHKVSGTLLLATFVIVKGVVLARGDITTALGIVQYAGVAGWAVAAVLSSLPLLAAAMLAITGYQVLWPLVGERLANWGQLLPVMGV